MRHSAKAIPGCALMALTLSTCIVPVNFEAPALRGRIVPGWRVKPRPFETSTATFRALTSSRVRKTAMQYPKPSKRPVVAPPFSLTATDGTGLELLSLAARAVVRGPLSFTELHFTFRNPRSRVIEGRFSVTLPPDAAISRFAMRLPKGWQEAEVVERRYARKVYEEYLHRGVDPALMEKKAGNAFRARIFPIPANGIKEIIISYAHALPRSDAVFRIPLAGAASIRSVDIQVMVARKGQSPRRIKFQKKFYSPRQDFTFRLRPGERVSGLRSGRHVVARIKPTLPDRPAPLESMLVLVDTSASRALGFARSIRKLGRIIRALGAPNGARLRLMVAAYDQTLEKIFEGPAGQFSRTHLERILVRRPLGASNLKRALQWAARQRNLNRVLLVTDAVPTAGSTDPDGLRRSVARMRGRVKRLDVLVVGGVRDESLARKLARSNLEQDGMAIDGELHVDRIVSKLRRMTFSNIQVQVPGVRFVWPRRLDGVQAGDEIMVFAETSDASPPRTLSLRLKGAVSQRHTVDLTRAPSPLLARAVAAARIASLENRLAHPRLGPKEKALLTKTITALSTRHRVLSDYTALLLLETLADYERFKIPRTALSDILTVGPKGVKVIRRKAPMLQGQPVEPARPRRKPTSVPMTKPPKAAPPAPNPTPATPPVTTARRRHRPAVAAPIRRPPPVAASVRRRPPVAASVRRPPPMAQRRVFYSLARRRRSFLEWPPSRRHPWPHRFLPYTGRMYRVMQHLMDGDLRTALILALRWVTRKPGDAMALTALGFVLTAMKKHALAARVFGSIIDLFPSRADFRRFAGGLLENLGPSAVGLAVDTYAKAAKQRPDHPSGHRLLAYGLLQLGRPAEAFRTLEPLISRSGPWSDLMDRAGVKNIIREDLEILAAAWARQDPGKRLALARRLDKLGLKLSTRPSLRFVLTWETDANDVDLHIKDGRSDHASFERKKLHSGGTLYGDVTRGYGPECFAIHGLPDAFPYHVAVHYYSRGPMGYGMGKLHVLQHDGRGTVRMAHRAFVIMRDRAWVDLGTLY